MNKNWLKDFSKRKKVQGRKEDTKSQSRTCQTILELRGRGAKKWVNK